MSETSFEEVVRTQVSRFLQTAVLVDDQALRRAVRPHVSGTEASGHGTAIPGDETAGGNVEQASMSEPEASPGPANAPVLELQPPTQVNEPEELDAALMARVFAERGLVCSILSPQTRTENDEIVEPLLTAASRADLLLLDWNLNDDNGATAKLVYERILASESEDSRRLRVISIYTGEPSLDAICDQLEAIAVRVMPGDQVVRDLLPQFTCGPVRVSVLAKQHVESLPQHHEEQRTAVEDLPDRLTAEFCRLCIGIVSCATIQSLAQLREQTHRLLLAMSSAIDAAFLGHRSILIEPSDAERHLEDLICAELASIVEDGEPGSVLNSKNLDLWITSRNGQWDRTDVSDESRLQFLTDGLSTEFIDRVKKNSGLAPKQVGGTSWTPSGLKALRAAATSMFASDARQTAESNRQFFERMQIRTRYARPKSALTLGVILESNDDFLLCVQPACDSVRLTTDTHFLFLTASKSAEEDPRGDDVLVVRDATESGGWLYLRVAVNVGSLELQVFAPTGGRRVIASERVDGKFFTGALDGREYRWVGQLKRDRAQQIMSKLAGELSRVGLNRPEVLNTKA